MSVLSSHSFPRQRYIENGNESPGAVLIEFSIIAWIFALFITLTIDIAQMLHGYMELSQLTFEGARTASMVEGLKEKISLERAPTDEERAQCTDDMKSIPHRSELPCGLFLAQYRMWQSITFTSVSAAFENFQVKTSFDGRGRVSVELAATYKAIFLPLRFVVVSAKTTLPYLVLGATIEKDKHAHK